MKKIGLCALFCACLLLIGCAGQPPVQIDEPLPPVARRIYPQTASLFVGDADAVAQYGSGAGTAPITGGTCTNQVVDAIAATTGIPTCATITSAFVDGTIAKTVVGVPPGLSYYGSGTEADPNVSSGVTTINGTHEYASFTISGSGQIKAGTTVGYAVIRVAGACSIASTATCAKEDGTNDTACAIDMTGPNNGVGTNVNGMFGGAAAGGGAAGTANNGFAGNNNWVTGGINGSDFPNNGGGSAGVVGGAAPTNGAAVLAGQAKAYLQILSVGSPGIWRMLASNTSGNFGGASGNSAGGAGTGTGGVGNGRGGGVLVLVCKSFTTTTGHILATGTVGGAGTSCGNAGGAGGSGGGVVIVAGPGGYTGANIDVNGGTGGAACAGGQNGAVGGKGMAWKCDTTAGICTQL